MKFVIAAKAIPHPSWITEHRIPEEHVIGWINGYLAAAGHDVPAVDTTAPQRHQRIDLAMKAHAAGLLEYRGINDDNDGEDQQA